MPDPDQPTLAASAIDELLDATGGDPGFLVELIDTFLTDAPAQVAAMREAMGAGEAEALVRPAHTLKSSAATFGATELAERCRALEAQARAGSLEGADAAVDSIETALADASAALSKVRDRGGAR
jgi:HPt (histidine-containing phosphotransfer) domain-containing protein